MNNKYDSIEKEIEDSIRNLKQMKEEIEKDILEMKREEEKQNILSDCDFLKEKISLINERLKTTKDINIMDYVMTLELIGKIIIYYKENSKISIDSYYDLVLSEIESTLDDLTIESLMIVINQYQDIDTLRTRQIKSSQHNKLKNNIDKRHKEFQKIIKRG